LSASLVFSFFTIHKGKVEHTMNTQDTNHDESLNGTAAATPVAPEGILSLQAARKIADELDRNHFIFVWGAPASGKTAAVTSIMYSMQQGGLQSSFHVLGVNSSDEYHDGRRLYEEMMRQVKNQQFPQRTMITIGRPAEPFRIQCAYVPRGEPPQNIIFLEMSGEDVVSSFSDRTRQSSGKLSPHIENYLRRKDKLVFLCTIPWHRAQEDDMHLSVFLTKLFQQDMASGQQQWRNRIILLVTLWDSNPNKAMDVTTFIRNNLPKSWALLQDLQGKFLSFSIGDVQTFATDTGGEVTLLRDINVKVGQKLFKYILESMNGVSYDPPPDSWWEQLKRFFHL
jgi:hypothetical protein